MGVGSEWGVNGWYFFFQAEDGIRGAQESRGLGDVNKRQGITRSLTVSAVNDTRDDLWNPTSGHRLTGSVEYLSLIHI